MADVSTLFTSDERDKPGETTTYYGTAVTDSAAGVVTIAIDGEVVNDPDLEETTVQIAADDFKEGRYQLVPPPSEGSVSVVVVDGDAETELEPEEFTIDEEGNLVIPALSGTRGVAITYRGAVRQIFEPSDLSNGSAILLGTPVGEIEAKRILNVPPGDDAVDEYNDGTHPEDEENLVSGEDTADEGEDEEQSEPIAYEVDGLTITFPSIEPETHSFSASYKREVSITLAKDMLDAYVPVEGEEPIAGVLYEYQMPDVPEEIKLYTTTFSEEEKPTYTQTDAYVLSGDMLYIQVDSEQYLLAYTMDVEQEFSSDDLEESKYQLEFEPLEDTFTLTRDDVAFTDYAIENNELTITSASDTSWQIVIEYTADLSLDLSTDDFVEGKYQLPSNPIAETIKVYVDEEEVAYELEIDEEYGNVGKLFVPSISKGTQSYSVSYTGLREDNRITLTTSPSVRAGETVAVQVVNGVPQVIAAAGSGDRQSENIEEAFDNIELANVAIEATATVANEVKAIAEATNQHFWHNDTGAYVTFISQDDWLNAQAAGFPDISDTNAYSNLLMTALGMILRSGNTNLTAWSESAVSFYDGQGNDAENIIARYGAVGIQLGSSELYLLISNNRISFMKGTEELAYFKDDMLNVENGEFLTKLRIGNFEFRPRATGNLSFVYIGG